MAVPQRGRKRTGKVSAKGLAYITEKIMDGEIPKPHGFKITENQFKIIRNCILFSMKDGLTRNNYIDDWRLRIVNKQNKKEGSLGSQVGGEHYKNLAIEPVEYAHENNLGFMEGSVVKYVTRYKDKEGVKDLMKAIHFLEMLIEMEYPDRTINTKKPGIGDTSPEIDKDKV